MHFSNALGGEPAAGFILGGMVGLLIVVALEWFQADVLRAPSEVERKLAVPVMGVIPGHES